MTSAVRATEAIDRFGPRMIFLAEPVQSGTDSTGVSLDPSAFVFGYAQDVGRLVLNPLTVLRNQMTDWELEEDPLLGPTPTSITGMSGAYMDLAKDPLQPILFEGQSYRYRYLLLLNREAQTMTTFLMAASPESWAVSWKTIGQMLETLTLPRVSGNIVGHISGGDRVNGDLEKETTDIWTFNGEAGRYATITLSPAEEGVDLTLTLIDPAGELLISMDNGFAGDLEAITDVLLPADGTYIIEAGEFFNEAGRYQLRLLLTDEPQFGGGGRLDRGQVITSELVSNGEHTWLFQGTAGESVTIVLRPLDDQLDIIMELRSPERRVLTTLDEGFTGDAEVLTGFELPVTGDYAILVRGFAGHGGTYSLSLDEGGETTVNFYDAGDLSYGESGRELLREDEAHAWFFDGKVGDKVAIELKPLEPNLDMDLWLLDPELRELVMKDENLSGQAELIEYELPEDGQYLVLVREFFGEPGQYEITLNIISREVLEIAGVIEYGLTVSGTLTSGKQAGWAFLGQAGDIIEVMVTPHNPTNDLIIILEDPLGNLELKVDETLSGVAEHLSEFTLDADGEWMILVEEFFGETSGYELTLSKVAR